MFQIKDFPSIAASMINHARATQSKLTDFNVGSVARTILEAPAIEIEELYQQMWVGLMESIPVAIYNSFGFSRLQSAPAFGIIRVAVAPSSTPSVIPAGSIFQVDGGELSFVSMIEQSIPANVSFVDVQVRAQTPGGSGNIDAGTSFSVRPAISAMSTAVALGKFIGGRDEETEAEQKERFAEFIRTISRATTSALEFGVSSAAVRSPEGAIMEQARFQSIVEPWRTDLSQPPALVNVYIHNGVDGASLALIEEVKKVLFGYREADGTVVPGWKAAGVRVDVYAANSISVNVTGSVVVASNFDGAEVIAQVSAAIADYIAALNIDEDVLFAEIVAQAMSVPGVINFLPETPVADILISGVSKAVVGAVSITAAEA